MAPRGAQEAPRRPQETPRGPQEATRGPKKTPRGPIMAPQKPHNCCPESPGRRTTRYPSRAGSTKLVWNLRPSCSHLGALFEALMGLPEEPPHRATILPGIEQKLLPCWRVCSVKFAFNCRPSWGHFGAFCKLSWASCGGPEPSPRSSQQGHKFNRNLTETATSSEAMFC